MTDPTIGSVDNGRRGLADFPFYRGEVGIRERDGATEAAFFARPVRLGTLPLQGTLDGQPVQIMAVRARDLNPEQPTRGRDASSRAIVATIIPFDRQEAPWL